jgi:ankyrin repeat protein
MTVVRSAALLLLVTAATVRAAGVEPAVVAAAKTSDAAAVRALVENRSDVNATEPDGTSALHWAVRAGNAQMVGVLLRAGARPNAANRYGVTPLSLAAQAGRADLLHTLVAAGASVGDAEAHLPEGHTLLMLASRAGDVDSVRALAVAGSSLNARETRTGTTAVIWAATSNRATAIRALAEAGADLNVRSTVTSYPHTQNGVLLTGPEPGISYVGQTVLPRGGWSAVMYAAREGAVDAVRALADSGAHLDLTDPEGTSALVIAIINGKWDVAAALVEQGADVNLADIKGMTPLYAAVDMHTLGNTFGRPNPPAPVLEGSVAIVRMLLAKGADPNARLTGPILKRVYDAGDNRLGEGATPFMRAARKADVSLMKLLLDAGADPKLAQKSGNTPLMLAAGAVSGPGADEAERVTEAQARAAIEICLSAGLDVNEANATGDTVLHTAASTNGGLPDLIGFLASAGARLDVRNNAGRTPLETALRARQPNEAAVARLRALAGSQ